VDEVVRAHSTRVLRVTRPETTVSAHVVAHIWRSLERLAVSVAHFAGVEPNLTIRATSPPPSPGYSP
jgi:alcohol dehydrogenase class IV